MAAAELRAAWQRTANRCFVQEDAKRAPKFACCQSSSSAFKHVDAEPTNVVDGPDHPAIGFMPLNRNPSFSKLLPDTRWYQKDVTYEQVNELEAKVEILRGAGTVNSTTKFDEVQQLKGDIVHIDDHKNCESSLDMQCGFSGSCMKKAPEARKQEVKALYSKKSEEYLELMDMREKYELRHLDPVGCPVSKQGNEFCEDPEWLRVDKTEPWWRTTDKDELASMVTKKSHNHIENCDLPPPQKMYVRRHPYAHTGCFDDDDALASSFDRKAQSGGISNRTHAQGCHVSRKTHGDQGASCEEGCSQYGSEKSFSSRTNSKDMTGMPQVSEGGSSKAQLMEALRHCQTRAREAEKTAKQVYAEKEHILKLFIRQTAQIFAYKKCFQLLQLETLYIRIKNNEKSISTLIPVVLPWMLYKGRKQRKSWQKATGGKRVKRGRPRHEIAKFAVAFSLRLSLVGAGLLVGWTVGYSVHRWQNPASCGRLIYRGK